MTRKDFVLIAAVVRTIEDWETKKAVARHFAARLGATYPRFDRRKFMRAALGEDET